MQSVDVTAQRALVGSVHANEAKWDATTAYSTDYTHEQGGNSNAAASEPRFKVGAARQVAAGQTCAGAPGLGKAGASEYATAYAPSSAQVRHWLHQPPGPYMLQMVVLEYMHSDGDGLVLHPICVTNGSIADTVSISPRQAGAASQLLSDCMDKGEMDTVGTTCAGQQCGRRSSARRSLPAQ